MLPTSVLSSIAAEWTGAPPADWCYWSYTNGVVTYTKTPAASSTATGSWGTWATPDGSSTGPAGTATGSWGAWSTPGAASTGTPASTATGSWAAWNSASGANGVKGT